MALPLPALHTRDRPVAIRLGQLLLILVHRRHADADDVRVEKEDRPEGVSAYLDLDLPQALAVGQLLDLAEKFLSDPEPSDRIHERRPPVLDECIHLVPRHLALAAGLGIPPPDAAYTPGGMALPATRRVVLAHRAESSPS